MGTENDNRIVDFLYDDLEPEDRQAFLGRLEVDPELSSQAASYSAVLSLVREHKEELTPSLASTEHLLEEARRQSRPWPSRLLGIWLPALAQRPAMAIATVAVLVLGLGVFAFLSGRGGAPARGPSRPEVADGERLAPRNVVALEEGAKAESKKGDLVTVRGERSTVSAASEPDADLGQAVALGDRSVDASDKNGLPFDELHRNQDKQALGRVGLVSGTTGVGSSASPGARAGGQVAPAEGRADRLRAHGPQANTRETVQKAAPKSPAAKPQPVASPATTLPAKPTFGSSTGNKLSGDAPFKVKGYLKADQPPPAQERKLEAAKDQQRESRSAPVLYNLANTSLSKGEINQACELFASLVRTHRDHPRRADALLGWARCEMARGAYGRAETIVQQLIKEHPSWRKSAETWLAEIQKQRQQAVLRAQRRTQSAQQQKAPARAAPRRPASNTTSY